MADVTFQLNGQTLKAAPGTLLIEAARQNGVEVPAFCYYPGYSLQAACRMCLVDIEKAPKLATACTVPVAEGMVVWSDNEKVRTARKTTLEFLLTNHPLDCPVCDKGGECELQDMVFTYGANGSRFVEEKNHVPEAKWSPVVYYDAPRCILCYRCIRVCNEGMGVGALGLGFRGSSSEIIPTRAIIWIAKSAVCASTSVLSERLPAERIATRRVLGKCSMSRLLARIARMVAR